VSEQHPIEALMTTAMQSIKEMVDVNTIVGDAVQAPDGTVIIPISKVTFGFAAGGGEYNISEGSGQEDGSSDRDEDDTQEGAGGFPFAGGSGAGVSISPVAFMVVGNGQFKLLPVNINSTVDRVLDIVPELLCKLEHMMKKKSTSKKPMEKEEDETE